jgi:hypothetical protein
MEIDAIKENKLSNSSEFARTLENFENFVINFSKIFPEVQKLLK